MKGIGLLLLYNLIFIIPFLLITLGVHFGFTMTAHGPKRWCLARLGTLRFISRGSSRSPLGVVMILAVQLGYL